MASTDIVAPAKQTFYEGDVAYKRSVSEALLTKVAASSNYITERIYHNEKIVMGGYFNPNSYDDGSGGVIRIRRDSDINEYSMYVRNSGTSSSTRFNANIYDSAGTFINKLFTANSLLISGSNGTNVLVGKEDVNTTPVDINFNTGGHTVSNGSLLITTLLAGYVLVPYVEMNGVNALNLCFNLKLQEQ